MSKTESQKPVTTQQIITAIRECARKLGHPPNRIELAGMAGINRRIVDKRVGGLSHALKLCDMKLSRECRKLKLPELLGDWANVVRKLNHLPTIEE